MFSLIPPLFRLGKSKWVLMSLVVLTAVSCSTVLPRQETLSDYYWEVQKLRLRASKASDRAEALRDLGIIYLRTGAYQEAKDVLSIAIAQEKTDPKLWFYTGLAREMLGDERGAVAIYQDAPTLSNTSLYSRAMKGRIEWLQSQSIRVASDDEGLQSSTESLSENVLIVNPFECSGRGAEYTNLGKGLSLLIGRNLEQLRGIDLVNYSFVSEAKKQVRERGNDGSSDNFRRVAHVLGAGKIIEGSCVIETNDRISVNIFLHDLLAGQSVAVNAEDFVQNITALERGIMNRLVEELRVWIPNADRRTPLNAVDLETLLMFSEGLASEDAGEYSQSMDYYNRALLLNPRFVLAEVRLEAVGNKILAQGSSQDELNNLLVYLESLTPAQRLMESRLGHIERAMGSGYVPGEDNRKLPPGNVGELPAPPRPDGN